MSRQVHIIWISNCNIITLSLKSTSKLIQDHLWTVNYCISNQLLHWGVLSEQSRGRTWRSTLGIKKLMFQPKIPWNYKNVLLTFVESLLFLLPVPPLLPAWINSMLFWLVELLEAPATVAILSSLVMLSSIVSSRLLCLK